MDEGSRIYLPRYHLPMHTTPLLRYPAISWCSNRDECLGTAGDHGGQWWAMAGETEDWRAFMLGLDAEDYATYTDAVHRFSVAYPEDFELLPATWEDEEVIDLHHPTLALGIRVSIHPFDPDGVVFADLAAMLDEYELEPPEGAQSRAVRWGGLTRTSPHWDSTAVSTGFGRTTKCLRSR
jgi:hypothetical protein